jgi:predicted ester cyclase
METDLQRQNKAVYYKFIDICNQQMWETLPEVWDMKHYNENCVGLTPGVVNAKDAVTAVKKLVKGIPNIRSEILDCTAEGDKVYAMLTVTGKNTGNLYGAPPTGSSFKVNMFDYVRLENGKIVDRIQQSDTLTMFRSIYANWLKWLGIILAVVILGLVVALVLSLR